MEAIFVEAKREVENSGDGATNQGLEWIQKHGEESLSYVVVWGTGWGGLRVTEWKSRL
jgi:hypothetical protein